MQLLGIKTDTFHTAVLSQYLNQSNTFQPLKHIASELDCANCDLVCYQLTIFIATVLVRSRELCSLCACDRERRALVVVCPLYNDIREKLLNDTSQRIVKKFLPNVIIQRTNNNKCSSFSIACTQTTQFSGTHKHCHGFTGKCSFMEKQNKYVSIGQVCFQCD